MVSVNRIVLDVLKPHEPNILEFAQSIAAVGGDCHVSVCVNAVDKNTESVAIEVSGSAIDYQRVHDVIKSLGGSLHSMDEVDVSSSSATVAGEPAG